MQFSALKRAAFRKEPEDMRNITHTETHNAEGPGRKYLATEK